MENMSYSDHVFEQDLVDTTWVTTTLLRLVIPTVGIGSVVINIATLIIHRTSLSNSLKTLWNTYRILDSQPQVFKALALLFMVFFWHAPYLLYAMPFGKFFTYFLLILTDLQICFMAFMVEGAFKALKKKVKEHHRLIDQAQEHRGLLLYLDEPCMKLGSQNGMDLSSLRHVHRQLVGIMASVNRAYSLGALIVTVSCRLLVTIYLYRWIISDFLTMQLVYALLTFQRIFYLCYRFECLKQVEKTTADMINTFDKSPLDARSRAEYKLFLIQMKSQRINFNSIEMFDLDFGLITSTFTTTITYLMLLQQFD